MMSAWARMGRFALLWLAALALPVHAFSAAGAFNAHHDGHGAAVAHCAAPGGHHHASHLRCDTQVAAPVDASVPGDAAVASDCAGDCPSGCGFAATALAPDHRASAAVTPSAVHAGPAPVGFASVIVRTLERPPRSTIA
jgi:hypothetical protein